MKNLPPVSLSERLLTITRNFALCFYLSGFSLFLAGWLWKWTDVVVFGIPLLFYSLWIFLSRSSFQKISFRSVCRAAKTISPLAFWIVVIFLVLNFLFCLLPPSEHIDADALLYNLTLPWQHYLRGGITPFDWSMNDKFPMYVQMAQLPFTVLGFPWVIKAFNIFALPALLILVWNFAQELGAGNKEAAWLTAFASSLALIIKQYGSANLDIVNTVYILFGFFYLVRASRNSKFCDLLWGAVFLGMACAVKSFMFYLLAVWGFSLIFWKILSRKKISGLDCQLILTPVFFALVFMAPFLIRNAMTTGNPFFPLFQQTFGPVIEHELHHQVLQHARYGYGYGHSFLDFLLMPLRMILPIRNPVFRFDYWTDPVLLVFLAAALFSLRTRFRTQAGLVSLMAFLLYTFLFLGSQQARYFYPFWILILLLGADSVSRWFGEKLQPIILTGQALLGIVSFGFFHRDALSHLKYLPQGKYLEKSSFSYVWNKTLHRGLHGKTVGQLCLRKAPGDSMVDLFYFTVPMKILGHTTSILPLDARFAGDCDQFMIGLQWPSSLMDSPIGQGLVVGKERYLNEIFFKPLPEDDN